MYSSPEMVRMALSVATNGALPSTATHTAADLSDEALIDAINEADSTINSYIGRFYTTPVALGADGKTPHPIDYWSRNLAAYSATLTFRGSLDINDADPVIRRYNATMEALRAVNAGSAQLTLDLNEGDHSAASAGDPINPFVGELFVPGDFDLGAPSFDPVYGAAFRPGYWGRW